MLQLFDLHGQIDSSRTVRSRVAKDGGKNPVWNEILTLHIIPSDQHKIRMDIWNKNEINSNAYIGRSDFPIAGALNNARMHQSLQVPVYRQSGKPKGVVNLRLQFEPSGGYLAVVPPMAQHGQVPWPINSESPPPYPGPPGYSPYAYPPGGNSASAQPVLAQPLAQPLPVQQPYPYNAANWSPSAPPPQPSAGYYSQYPQQPQQQPPPGYPPQIHSAHSGYPTSAPGQGNRYCDDPRC